MTTQKQGFGDFSHYELNINFLAMAAAGIIMAVTKATQGLHNVDVMFKKYWDEMKAAGLYRFDFLYLMPGEGVGDVKHFEDTSHLGPGDGQPIVDAEQNGLTETTVDAAMAQLEADGFKPIIYASFAYWRDVLGSTVKWPIWLADYNGIMPAMPKEAVMFAWQHTDKGHCPGVPQACDMNVFLGGDVTKFLIPSTFKHAV